MVDCARLQDRDDLLLFFRRDERRTALQVAPGGARARLAPTRRRFSREQFATGPLVDRLRELLVGCRLEAIEHAAGERRCLLTLASGDGPRRLVVELFGPRGFWGVMDADGRLLATSRLARRENAQMAPGQVYRPPGGPPPPPTTDAPRFSEPVGEAIDAYFTELDLEVERHDEQAALRRAAERRIAKLEARIAQLTERRTEAAGADDLRLRADLLLAYGFGHGAAQPVLEVPHPHRPGETVLLHREPGVPVQAQAKALYRQARKLTDGAAITEQRLDDAARQLRALREILPRLDAEGATPALTEALQRLEVGIAPGSPSPSPDAAKVQKQTGGEPFRRFHSAEGYPIWVGRDPAQNDRLTTRVARGNDLWLHVGDGRTGSHVVVRLPRGKTASLETLLDAATLAVHFSKARGVPRCDVLYTQAKHVRKPKGSPAGRVLPSRTKTITVRLDEARLRRLLDGSAT